MKQLSKLLISTMFLFLITACGGSDREMITCKNATEDDGLRIETEVISYFVDDQLDETTFEFQYNLDNTYQPYIDQIEQGIKDDYKDIIDQKGVHLETEKKNDNQIDVTLTATFSNMDNDTKEYFDMIPLESGIEEYKKTMEEKGYTCYD